MYHALLTNRYLTSRVIPLIAVAAVALCVALVIIVVSVMTGFLDMVKASGRTLMGDVVVSYPISGIPHYERLIAHIEKLPEAVAASPIVDSGGLLRMPYPSGDQKQIEMVQIWGIEPESFARVTGYEETLWWTNVTVTESQRQMLLMDVIEKHWREVLADMNDQQQIELLRALLDRLRIDESYLAQMSGDDWESVFRILSMRPNFLQEALTQQQWRSVLERDPRLLDDGQILREGLTMKRGGDSKTIVLGMHVSEANQRQRDGSYAPIGLWWMPRFEVMLTTVPLTSGRLDTQRTETRILQVVNEFVSGVFLIDDNRVMIPLAIAQKMMHLDEGEKVDPENPDHVLGPDPARATMVLVRAAAGVTPEKLKTAVERAYDDFESELRRDEAAVVKPPWRDGFVLTVKTWAQQQAQFIGPVEKEREIMRTLFSLVYIVCAGLVLAIFWAIVYEKTRDIGILRSVGASRMGITWIFLRYGLVVGVLGAIGGLGLGYVIVRNINVIHDALGNPPLTLVIALGALAAVALVFTAVRSFTGRLLPVVLGGLVTVLLMVLGGLSWWLYHIGGIIVWNPEVYYFSRIPNEVDFASAYATMIGAVIFSLIGAFIPAAKAADTDPVQALRYE